ncbi:MAG: hypothetical protein A2750_01045 [Candidatus Yanofskybacteria bacterium RIFCSPHIGHO2_01_FULL_45_42]|uniref:SHSP domain-containing protein n=3 Tax=Candidatus Yanofskyibacteriota TaxID=1752733 RepID=A0A1F8H4E9_9BACT|nr:MAG: hypothetical protein A2750_01045 [Candidatus Yanofskybacteria bacterium RIFCSPHIGHO2_01_FULL_45_42]OGN15499.1 MAG: hypothetical protein A3C81_01235 [Candidatus Yanofskybacteria bacterium RIFCSPHIGHO2_02_FULL_46_19]OGN27206.1 MAG: hypothetical protein A3B17_01145 [Candidatus Yanofskybacteria bacterium RIFCSPLOWO2_01_FULL_45_72]OGN31868.1 MAG: hypothetical protein A3J01_01780 [Candidatus Yanofskybacteria bacterium RIFCSPLOWO2_02_FULL_45_18]
MEFNIDDNTRQPRSKKTAEEEIEGALTVDIFQTDNDIVIQSTIAGVDQEDLDISLSKDMVTIRGHRQPEYKLQPADYYYKELYWGPFSRSVILPMDVNVENAKASIKNGILTLRLPKLEKNKVTKLKVSI